MERKPDVIVAFAFGVFEETSFYPPPNRAIGVHTETLARIHKIPIVTQVEKSSRYCCPAS